MSGLDGNQTGAERRILLATVKGITSLVAFDLATGEVIGSAKTGAKPHEIALSKDNKTAFVSIYGDADYGRNRSNNEIGVIDLVSMTETARIDLDLYRAPHGMITDAAGNIWVTVEESQSVIVINPETLLVDYTIWLQVPVHFLAQSRDGKQVYCSHKEYPFLSVIDVETRAVVQRLSLPRGAQALSVSIDDRLLYAGDLDRPLLHVFERESGTCTKTVDLKAVPGWPYPTPDGRYVIVTTFNEKEGAGFVEILNTQDLSPHALIAVGAEPYHSIALDDDRHILVALADGRIPTIDAVAGKLVEDKFHATSDMPETLKIIEL